MNRKKAILALLLLVPVPSIGVFSAMVLFPNSPTGAGIFTLCKLWLFAFPALWYKFAEKGKFSLSPPKEGGFGMGFFTGILISAAILLFYIIAGSKLLDRSMIMDKVSNMGLAYPGRYIGAAAYWILVNSVLEEYVWRWFVVRQLQALISRVPAILLSAIFFTLHHIVAMQVYLSPLTVAICSAGIFIGGAVWSLMYIRYKSVWPGYLSHAIVDLCIFAIGASIIFGG